MVNIRALYSQRAKAVAGQFNDLVQWLEEVQNTNAVL